MVNGNQFQVWEFNSFDCAKRTVIGIYGQAVHSCKRANQFRIRINWKDQTVSVLNDTHQHQHRVAVDGRRQSTQPYTCWRFDTNAENYIVIWGWFHVIAIDWANVSTVWYAVRAKPRNGLDGDLCSRERKCISFQVQVVRDSRLYWAATGQCFDASSFHCERVYYWFRLDVICIMRLALRGN